MKIQHPDNNYLVIPQPAIELRDQFAMSALIALANNYQYYNDAKDIAKNSYILSDAMLEARDKKLVAK